MAHHQFDYTVLHHVSDINIHDVNICGDFPILFIKMSYINQMVHDEYEQYLIEAEMYRLIMAINNKCMFNVHI